MSVNPFVRWAGGKRDLAPRLVEEILATSPTLYIEPFLGGGAVALALPRELKKILADVNPQLIDVWLCFKSLPSELYKELDAVCAEFGNGEAGYYKARSEFNKMANNPRKMWARRSAFFLYLNARCFNGLWRVGPNGFNVPYGKLEKPRSYHWADDLFPVHQQLAGATIVCEHFLRVIPPEIGKRIGPPLKNGDVTRAQKSMQGVCIYSDSPYHGTFDGYAKDGFTDDDQKLLEQTLGSAAAAGAAVWASNSDTEFIRELYSSWAEIEVIDERHSVGAKAKSRGMRGCVLIRGGAAIRG